MLRYIKIAAAATALAGAVHVAQAAPVVVDFNAGVNGANSNTLSVFDEDGFHLGMTRSTGNFVGDSAYIDGSGAAADDGSKYLFFWGLTSSLSSGFTLTANDGSLFSLQAFDASEGKKGGLNPNRWAKSIKVIGTKDDNSQVSVDFALDLFQNGLLSGADFQTFNFGAEFINLKSVSFAGLGATQLNTNWFGVDNITASHGGTIIDEGTGGAGVPEPSSLALVGLALFGMGSSLRLGVRKAGRTT